MQLFFNEQLAASYTSVPQKIRIMTEHWVGREAYCPSCGNRRIERYANNTPVADFFCPNCHEDYELKSQRRAFGTKIVDGAFRTMMERLIDRKNPNLFLLNYDSVRLEVSNLICVPKHFFVPQVIERRKPLASSARRYGWIGCNILLQGIPDAGRIFLIRDGLVETRAAVLTKWQRTMFIREQTDVAAKGWLLDVMRCVDTFGRATFSLAAMYSFEDHLKRVYPGNRHIKEKIRQQLQVLRDKGYLEFLGKGTYRVAPGP
jgi:type II restriction enzyme